MRYYPILLDVKGQKCLIVGGGSVGTRKVMTLLKCGAIVTVVSPEISHKLVNIENTINLILIKRDYKVSDLTGMFLVIGATNNDNVNYQISNDAKQNNILCNIVDDPKSCNFILPSVFNRGDLTISISTAGKSPGFAKKMRKELELQFGDEYSDFLVLMGNIRKKLLSQNHNPDAHKALFDKLIKSRLLEMIKYKQTQQINQLLFDILGKGFIYDELINF